MAIHLLAPEVVRPLLEGRLPARVEPRWFASPDEAVALSPWAEIAWLDDIRHGGILPAIAATGAALRWLTTIAAGVERFPLAELRARGVQLTNGRGVNAGVVAEFTLAAMLHACKRLDKVAAAQAGRRWLTDPPGTRELAGSRALIIGMGAIGTAIADRLRAFDVSVTGVRRSADCATGSLGPDTWRAALGRCDWVILAAPATGETHGMIGAAELRAMRDDAWLVNVARGTLVDTDALVVALRHRVIGGAVLDVTDPEPLPPQHPLWTVPNAFVTMHLASRAQERLFDRGSDLFLANLDRYMAGAPLRNLVDLDLAR